MNDKLLIEFYSGSGNISAAFKSKGWITLTIDNNAALCPDVCCNVLDINIHDFCMLPGMLWFSNPCDVLSRAAKQSHFQKTEFKYRQYHYSPVTDKALISVLLIKKTVSIINHFKNIPFVIENPIGRMQHFLRDFNLGHYRYFVNYADFGYKYSKETYLFTNILLPLSTKKYKVSAPGLRTIRSKYERSKVPYSLGLFIESYIH